MHQSINQQHKPGGLAGAKSEPLPSTSDGAEGLTLPPLKFDQSKHQSPEKSGVEVNLKKAMQEGASSRRASLLSGMAKAGNQYAMATLTASMGFYNATQVGLSFASHPVISTFTIVAFVSGFASALQGALITYQELKQRRQSLKADTISSAPEFEKANALRAHREATRQDLLRAGDLYLKYIDDSHGVQLAAQSLIGVFDCLTRLGVCTESALLLSKVGPEMSPRYHGLPVQTELMRFALEHASEMYAVLPDNESRLELTESIGRLAFAGAKHNRTLAVQTAVRLHNLARELPQEFPLVRADLLETAFNLSSRTDSIRENIEAQLQEIADGYLHRSTTLRRTRLEIERILRGVGIRPN